MRTKTFPLAHRIVKTNTTRLQAVEALRYLAVNGFIGNRQRLTVLNAMLGEERQYFYDKMVELADLVKAMPSTRGQEGVEDPIVHLHYFTGGFDWYITEKDKIEEGQHQAFGLVSMFEREWGYISLTEVTENGGELDFHWTPKPISQIKKLDQ